MLTQSVLLQQQAEVTSERKAQRQEVFVAPVEEAAPTVEEKRDKKKKKDKVVEDVDVPSEKSKKRKRKEREEAD